MGSTSFIGFLLIALMGTRLVHPSQLYVLCWLFLGSRMEWAVLIHNAVVMRFEDEVKGKHDA